MTRGGDVITDPDIRDALTGKTSTEIKETMGNHRLILLDEAQRVQNIGLTLKLIVDNFSDIQVIATFEWKLYNLTN